MNDTPTSHLATYPECGGSTVDGLTCWEQLGALIAWEYDDPELAAEHFLTVAAYNLQHPAQFTDDDVGQELQEAASVDAAQRVTGQQVWSGYVDSVSMFRNASATSVVVCGSSIWSLERGCRARRP
ncbi:MAG TPA: DUF5946 family protein [Herpetosiphonaceae bacterium]